MRDQTKGKDDAISFDKLDKSKLTRREGLAIGLARSLADNPFRVTDAQLDELRTEFSNEEIVEMIFACAIFSWGNIVGIATRVDTDPSSQYGSGCTFEEGYRRKVTNRKQ